MESSASGGEEAVTFSRELSAMKRRGSNILVVGTCVSDAHLAACRRLLGESTGRRRLFVFTNDGCGLGRRCDPSECDASSVRIVDCGATTRSAASTTPSSPSSPTDSVGVPDATESDDPSAPDATESDGPSGSSGSAVSRTAAPVDDLAVLGNAIGGGIAYFENAADGLDPAELRVCLDSLGPLVAQNDDRKLFRFLHAVTRDVRRVSGMGHYHLSVPHDDEAVAMLSPLFDAVVEVRTRTDHEQRWHLQDPEFTTDWLAL